MTYLLAILAGARTPAGRPRQAQYKAERLGEWTSPEQLSRGAPQVQ